MFLDCCVMYPIYDFLYQKSQRYENFNNLMKYVFRKENVFLAYKAIKIRSGLHSYGADEIELKELSKLTLDEIVLKVQRIISSSRGYLPKPVQRVKIYQNNGTIKPISIPCIWDRLIQQCISQILDPICEGRFIENSYGYRHYRSTENAIASASIMINQYSMYYVIPLKINNFYESVNHHKLMRQLWSFGIHDKKLLWLIGRILKTPMYYVSNHGPVFYPTCGIVQCGNLYQLLTNIVLNELDHRVDKMWCNHPVTRKYAIGYNKNDSEIKSAGFYAMKKTKLREARIVRFGEEILIFCRNKNAAEDVKTSLIKWIDKRLCLNITMLETAVIDVRKKYVDFLGFRLKSICKGNGFGKIKNVVISRMSCNTLSNIIKKLKDKVKRIKNPRPHLQSCNELRLYNLEVMGIHQYYKIATHISKDCRLISRQINTIITNRLGKANPNDSSSNITKIVHKKLSSFEEKFYGRSKQIRYLKSTNQPIYPIGFVQFKIPKQKRRCICPYTITGRQAVYGKELYTNVSMLRLLMLSVTYDKSIEYIDNRIMLYMMQNGQCSISGAKFDHISQIQCHHKIPIKFGGDDSIHNLILITKSVHILIHATNTIVIDKYMKDLNLSDIQLEKVNYLRKLVNLPQI